MEGFSLVSNLLDRKEAEIERRASLAPADPWPKEWRTPEARAARVDAAEVYDAFDHTYFPPEMYSQGYAEPGAFQAEVAESLDFAGVTWWLGARDHAKTATAKKKFVHRLLYGLSRFGGTLSQTLLKSHGILDDIYHLIEDNPRIKSDFDIEWLVENEDEISFIVRRPGRKPVTVTVRAYSEERSVKGSTKGFDRPDLILCDDIETRQSSLTPESVAKRARIIAEAVSSMAEGGTFIGLGNNFDEACLMNQLLREYEAGLLPAHWRVFRRPAWHNNGPLWPERWDVGSEAELRDELEVFDDEEWEGDYMQRPRKPDGIHFKRSLYREYIRLPKDARGVSYTDPNISEKGKGDTTASITLLYSPEFDEYYIGAARCKSYDDPDDLIADVMDMRDRTIRATGWDGNVSQEVVWKKFVRQHCRRFGIPVPPIEFMHYHVDQLAKNAMLIYNAGRLLFPPGFALTEEGKRFLDQFFAFTGKKANRKDDAPDAVICGVEFIHERKLVKSRTTKTRSEARVIPDAIKPF